VTTIRIAHAEPRPGKLPHGGFHTRGHLVVLADDAGRRAVPIWMQGADDLASLLARPADQTTADRVPQELAIRLLGAGRARVTGVDIDLTDAAAAELSPEVTVARIGLTSPSGSRQVTAHLGLGLALAVAAGAPVRVADAVLDRLAVPVPGDDLLTPFLDRVPPEAWPARPAAGPTPPRWPLATLRGRPRYEPRNLDFAGGLDRWDLDAQPAPAPGQPGAADQAADVASGYAAAADGSSAVLTSTAASPAGSAALLQAVYADDYRGRTVTFSGELSGELPSGQAGLRLEIVRHWRRGSAVREDRGVTIAGHRPEWTGHQITARIPADADLIRFGIALHGPGRIALRNPGLRVTEPAAGTA
jgi:bifunctional DNase/RNase